MDVSFSNSHPPFFFLYMQNDINMFWVYHSLPGAIGMFGLVLGVAKLDQNLPTIVYAFLSGLNASTVGIIALAAVQVNTGINIEERAKRKRGSKG